MATFRSKNLPRHSSSEDSDSSDDETPWKRKCNKRVDNDNDNTDPFVNPLAGQKPNIKAQKFKVWSNVLTDQSVTGELCNFDLVEEKVSDTVVARDVESYRVTAEAVKKLYPDSDVLDYQDLDAANDDMDTDEEKEEEEDKDEDGVDDFAKLLNSYKKAKVEWDSKPKDLREKIKNRKRTNDLRGRIEKNKMDRENQSGGQTVFTSDAKFQSDIPRASAEDGKEAVLKCIVDTLQETNEELFTLILDNVDCEKALELLNKTEDVENAGGMMIKSGIRRRTPGGVYIQLLRSDPIATPEVLKAIFPQEFEQKELQKRRKKEIKRLKRKGAIRRRQGDIHNLVDMEEVNANLLNAMEDETTEANGKNGRNETEMKSEEMTKVDDAADSGAEDGEIVSD